MTPQNYSALAAALASTRPYVNISRSTNEQRSCYALWRKTRARIMIALRIDNPHFDRDQFLDATEAEGPSPSEPTQ